MPSRQFGYLSILLVAIACLAQARQRSAASSVTWDVVAMDLCGIAIFLLLSTRLSPSTDSDVAQPGLLYRLTLFCRKLFEYHPGRVGLVLLSLQAIYLCVVAKPAKGNGPDLWLPAVYWLAGILMFLGACAPSDLRLTFRRASASAGLLPGPRLSAKVLANTRMLEAIAVAGLTVAAFFLRAVSRGTVPYPLSGDEASVAMNGLGIFQGKVNTLFGVGWSSHPTLSFVLPGFLQALMGDDMGALRLYPAIVGSLAVPAIYLLARELWDNKLALVAAAYMAAYFYHLHFSRIAVTNIFDPTIAAITFYFFWRGLRTGRSIDFALSGVFTGLCFYSYPGGRLIFVLMIALIGYYLIFHREVLARYRLQIVALFGALLVTAIPILLYFIGHPTAFMDRANQVGILQTGWLDNELRKPGASLLGILMSQFSRSLLAFVHIPAGAGFINSPEPLLGPIAGMMATLGFAWCVWNWKRPACFLVAAWILSVAATNALTVDQPNSARMLISTPDVVLLVAVGLRETLRLLQAIVQFRARAIRVLGMAALVLLCAGSLRFYFMEYTPNYYFADANSELGMEAGYYLRSLGPQYKVYFFGLPRMFVDFPSLTYLRRDMPGMDMQDKFPRDFAFVEKSRGAVFILIPERAREAEQLKARFPEATMMAHPRKVKEEVLFYSVDLRPDYVEQLARAGSLR